MQKVAIHWMRRDLRLDDNTALFHALNTGVPVIILYIYDPTLLKLWDSDNPRVTFIHDRLTHIDAKLQELGSGVHMMFVTPQEAFEQLSQSYDITGVFANKDYEPAARERDAEMAEFLEKKSIQMHTYKDQVIFEESEITKENGDPYVVYTPYKNKWRAYYESAKKNPDTENNYDMLFQGETSSLSLNDIGCTRSHIKPVPSDLGSIDTYKRDRDFPAKDSTSHLSVYLRFGTVSIRKLVDQMMDISPDFVDELIWREFFMQILYHFPRVVDESFRPEYDDIKWRNNEDEFVRWCKGETGYPLVDAGMRELNQSGYMHNRVRMVVASFLCKHLLIDWRWGERYFASKLLDYELAANNGNWQWAAGSGCDAAPYFRVFNPTTQFEKFDPEAVYVKKWVPEYGTDAYPQMMVDHKMARERVLTAYKKALKK